VGRWVEVRLGVKESGLGGSGQGYCAAPIRRKAFAPGTNGSGDFDFTLDGWGVGWTTGDGGTLAGSFMTLYFKEGGSEVGAVYCGKSSKWPNHFPCDHAPDIYGTLASPDLIGTDGYIDSSDLGAFDTLYYGRTITANSGWQADFNHDADVSPTVDASDLAYFAGRMGQYSCASSKAGDGYAMDVRNLELDDVRDVLQKHGLTATDMIRAWDAMGLSYDHEAAADILAGRPSGTTSSQHWSAVKVLYR
jgi:hypothetical protein